MTSKQFGLPKIDSKMHCFFDCFFHLFLRFSLILLPKNQIKSIQKSIPRCITFSIDFSIDLSSILAPFWKPTWIHVGHLEATWGRLGGLLGGSWAVLEASWGLLAAKTHQERGQCEFWKPLGAVLASFLGSCWMVFKMNFLFFSYLIFKDVNMS